MTQLPFKIIFEFWFLLLLTLVGHQQRKKLLFPDPKLPMLAFKVAQTLLQAHTYVFERDFSATSWEEIGWMFRTVRVDASSCFRCFCKKVHAQIRWQLWSRWLPRAIRRACMCLNRWVLLFIRRKNN